MGSKVYFNVERVTKIEFSKEFESSYKFYPSESRGRFKFLWLIPLWKKDDLPDRWSDSGQYSYYNDDDYMKNDVSYRIQDFPKKVFRRAWVRVSLGYKDNVFQRFDSDQEAQEFVDLIINTATNPFEVIIVN